MRIASGFQYPKCTSQNALVIHNYLFVRSQKTKMGSILVPLLFDINGCDLFLSEYSFQFTNSGDDTTPYECGKNYDEMINKLEDTIETI